MKIRVSEIRVKRIRVNQGLGVSVTVPDGLSQVILQEKSFME